MIDSAIPPHFHNQLADYWKSDGRACFCYLDNLWQFAIRARDYAFAAEVDFLHDVHAMRVEIAERRAA